MVTHLRLIACSIAFAAALCARGEVKAAFTDSTAAPLAATKRVAITSVIVSFQASTGDRKDEKGGLMNVLNGFGRDTKKDALTVLQLVDLDPKMAAAIGNEIYAQLQADLKASGFEVVPEATVLANATYKKIIAKAGFPNLSKFGNGAGDVLLVGPDALKPYLPYALELGQFGNQPKSYIKGWVSAFGSSSTEGGPTKMALTGNYELPGLEVALAKELNAHVVKATYLVTLGSATSSIGQAFSSREQVDVHYSGGSLNLGKDRITTKTVTGTGNAHAQVGLFPLHSRIAFRTPGGNSKGFTVSRTQAAPPAKDGDVVVALAEPIVGGTDFFTANGKTKESGIFSKKAAFEFDFTATITDPTAYATEVIGMIVSAQRAMLAQVKQ